MRYYAFNSENHIAARGSGSEKATCWVIDTSTSPFLSNTPALSPKPTNNRLISQVLAQSMVPTKSLPSVKLVLPGRTCKTFYNLGFQNSPEECATAALDDLRCDNLNFIMWSCQHPQRQVCGCCD